MVRVHGQVTGRILWKWKRMFHIIFRLLPTVLPRTKCLLPLKIQTHPPRDCSLSFEKPLPFLSRPSSNPLSSTVVCHLPGLLSCVDCPCEEARGWAEGLLMVFLLFWGSQADTAALATSVSKEGRQACGTSPERAQTTFRHGKTIQVCFFRTTRGGQGRLQDFFFF